MARQDVKDEVVHMRSAGVDLGKRFLVACTRVPSSKRTGSKGRRRERGEDRRTGPGAHGRGPAPGL